MQWRFVHEFVNKTESYVRGRFTSTAWRILVAAETRLKGTYVAVEPFHLERYVDSKCFGLTIASTDDGTPITAAERFALALPAVRQQAAHLCRTHWQD